MKKRERGEWVMKGMRKDEKEDYLRSITWIITTWGIFLLQNADNNSEIAWKIVHFYVITF